MFAIIAAILVPILRIVSVLCTCYGNNTYYLCDLQENKDALDTAMKELKDAGDDVKRRVDEAENNLADPMKCNKQVSGWLQHVQAIEVKVVKVIQKADKDIKGRCFGGCCPKNCWSASKTGKRVIQTLATVKDLKSQGINFVDVAHKLPPPSVQNEPVNLPVGMNSTLKKVLESLAEDEVRIMGIYGQGGVGKTTLLKQINNEFLKSTTTTTTTSTSTSASASTSTTYSFDVVIYVVVSKTFNIDAVQMEIGNRLRLLSSDRISIFNALTKKKFLLLLDDIWEGVDLQSIGVPPVENSKSKVIFTTRSEIVCGQMDASKKFKVGCLPWDEAWTLFQKKVGNEALNSNPKVELAKVVARECGGLPLALITIGRAMSTNKTIEEWNHAITTLRKSASKIPGMGDEVLPLLRLSYDSLPNDTIKSCFLYCALYPEDEPLFIPKLVDYWIGEGLISLDESDDIDDARNHGYHVIGILKSVCLLESDIKEETQVKMHDSIRDLALWIAYVSDGIKKDKMVIARASEHTTSERLWFNAERVYYSMRIDWSFIETKITPPKSPNLRTLLFKDTNSGTICSIPDNFFEFMPLLRVLDLYHSYIETFPTSITELLELQYLNLSHTCIKVLPEELRKLVKLRYLDLSDMYFLKEIPSGVIGSLLELRVLNLQGSSDAVDWDIEEVYNLKYLNDFRICINTQQNLNKLLSNQNLLKCVRHLRLDNSIHGAFFMNHYYYNIEQQHLGSCFQNLSNIEIYNSKALKHLTWVGYVDNLKELYVYGCKELEEIVKVDDDFGGSIGEDEEDIEEVDDDFGGSTGEDEEDIEEVDDDDFGGSTGEDEEDIEEVDDDFGGSTGEDEEDIEEVDDDFGGSTGEDEIASWTNNVEDVRVFKRLEYLTVSNLPKLKSICRNALAFPCLKFIGINGCPQLKKLPFDHRSNANNTLRQIDGGKKWWSELQWEEDGHHNNDLKSKFLPYFIGCM